MQPVEIVDLLEQRRKSHDFRWASRTWTPSPYFIRGQGKSPRDISITVLRSQRVQDVIQSEMSKSKGEKSAEDITKIATDLINELAHDFQMYSVRWFGLVLSKIAKRLYDGIQVNVANLERVREAYKSYPVVLLPTHRSYVDFLLISYMSFAFELPLPIIAAGMDFKGMVGVGEMLRKSGAFFIRRRFGGDALYWAVITEYLQIAVMEGNHPVEMFVEGTRSRSGKSLPPKIGLLSIIADLVKSGQIPDVLLLPISMSYDRTLEDRLYAREVLGKPKPRESTNGLMKALKWLGNQNYGSVYVEFGDLISIRQEVEKTCIPATLSISQELFLETLKKIAVKVVLEQQRNLVIPLFAGISLILLSKISRGCNSMLLSEIVNETKFLQHLLRFRNLRFGFPMPNDTLDANISHILSIHSSIVSIQLGTDSNEAIVTLNSPSKGDPVTHLVLQHYANQILHCIVPFSLIAIIDEAKSNLNSTTDVIMNPESGVDKISSGKEAYILFRKLFQDDFICQPENLSEEYDWTLDIWKNSITMEGILGLDLPSTTSRIQILKSALEPYFIAYWGLCITLQDIYRQNGKTTSIHAKDIIKTSQDFVWRQLEQERDIKLPYTLASLSLETIGNGISSLLKLDAIESVKTKDSTGPPGSIIVQNSFYLDAISSRLGKLMDDWILNNPSGKYMEPHLSPPVTFPPSQLLRAKL